MRVAAIILIVVGILMLIFKGINFTKEKKVVDIGPVEINKKEKHSVNWPLYAGGIAIAAGAVMLFADKKK
jgi:UDP-N-acetylmuramyl pentapeptide phosphotransferase/UDP-N-acetylglucosamine-1-phosphate transferase